MPGTVAYVWLFSEPRLLGVVTVKADGTFEGSLPLAGLDQGQHTLQVNGTNANGRPKAANLGVIVNQAGAPIPGPGRLPATGNDGGSTMITVAVLLMLAGGLTRVGRRPVR
jgi:LPXTG-motif cell wall-anchored protein